MILSKKKNIKHQAKIIQTVNGEIIIEFRKKDVDFIKNNKTYK